MQKLVDIIYYADKYKGTDIPTSLFDEYAMKASSRVVYFTTKSIKEITDDIRNATCEIAELIYSQDTLKKRLLNGEKEKASETVGPHSVTYVNMSSTIGKNVLTQNELEKECYKIYLRHLSHTGLCFRGVRNVSS